MHNCSSGSYLTPSGSWLSSGSWLKFPQVSCFPSYWRSSQHFPVLTQGSLMMSWWPETSLMTSLEMSLGMVMLAMNFSSPTPFHCWLVFFGWHVCWCHASRFTGFSLMTVAKKIDLPFSILFLKERVQKFIFLLLDICLSLKVFCTNFCYSLPLQWRKQLL